MQTFLPFPDFQASAQCLDRQRLGKQRIEAWQILQQLTHPHPSPWQRHPAVLMWKGFEGALAAYGIAICDEWRRRGYQDTMRPRFSDVLQATTDLSRPPWLGTIEVHATYRAALLYKDPAHYSQFGWTEAPVTLDAQGRIPYAYGNTLKQGPGIPHISKTA